MTSSAFVDYCFICGFNHVITKSYGTLARELLLLMIDFATSINSAYTKEHIHDSEVLERLAIDLCTVGACSEFHCTCLHASDALYPKKLLAHYLLHYST